MTLDVDNGLPSIEVLYILDGGSEVSHMCYLDSFVATKTGNLRLDQWLITKYPNIVSEYILCNHTQPF